VPGRPLNSETGLWGGVEGYGVTENPFFQELPSIISMLEGSAWRRPSTCHKAGDPRPDAGPQSEKLGAQQPAKVIGQPAWTNQAHVSAHNVPYLWGKSPML
jgi:hypothetical protein